MNAARIEFYRSHLAGTRCARCTGCGHIWAYWDEPEDLAHACPTTCTACEGKGETDPVWDDDTHTHTRRICSSCGGTGAISQMVEV
jgi:DnaJ-class molecular chaperone